ncbi:MAG TPA: hypothetical protein ENI77_13265 [Nitrospirae bacterium]|nr:hypothetical protein [Nitrospirota bacterium]
MKILFVVLRPAYIIHIRKIIISLRKKGNTVEVGFLDSHNKTEFDNGPVEYLMSETDGVLIRQIPNREDKWTNVVKAVRSVANYLIYFRDGHKSRSLAVRFHNKLPYFLLQLLQAPFVKKILNSVVGKAVFRYLERVIPEDKTILAWLQKNKPDVVIACPYIFSAVGEIDYVKSAKKLGIPTGAIIPSWDNLTTKGSFHVLPDTTFVWNDKLASEAIKLHDIPKESIYIAGAFKSDYLFAQNGSFDKGLFFDNIGLELNSKYILYLCSSANITSDETEFVKQFATTLANSPLTKQLKLVVRPHPLGTAMWEGFDMENVVVWPLDNVLPDNPSSERDYYYQLKYCEAVVGINTSALLEAAIVDKPCVTILSDKYKYTQFGLGHFHHLLNGGFMEISDDLDKAVAIIANITDGIDSRKVERNKFVKEFIRPHGLNKEVGEITGDYIESMTKSMS